jgi:hypothetical protein
MLFGWGAPALAGRRRRDAGAAMVTVTRLASLVFREYRRLRLSTRTADALTTSTHVEGSEVCVFAGDEYADCM